MRDWSLPGYKYLGPGNKLDKGKPTNRNDEVAFRHDVLYDKYIKEGKNPYLRWSDADEKAVQEFSFDDYGGAAGKLFFKGKRFAYQAGLIGHVNDKAKKRLRGSDPVIEPSTKKQARAKEDTKKKIATEKTRAALSNLTSQAPSGNQTSTMAEGRADGGGSGLSAGLRETPIDEVMNVSRGPPDYTFATLPFMSLKKYFSAQSFSTDLALRMTSPYDPEVTSNVGFTLNAPTTVPVTPEPDGTIRKARWFDFYAGLYKYYHVVSCRYSIFVENLSGEPLYVHLMHYNDELPPAGATNEDIMLWQGVRTQILSAPYKAVVSTGSVSTSETQGVTDQINDDLNEDDTPTGGTSNYNTGNHVTSRGGHTSCNFSGTYTPGQFRREIVLDAQVENWTAVTTNPALSERLLIRLKPENPSIDPITSGGDTIHAKIQVKLEYLVEFKELVSGLRWPVQRQPLTVTVSADANSIS